MDSFTIDIFQGSNFRLDIQVKDDGGLPLNLEDYELTSEIKNLYTEEVLGNFDIQVGTPYNSGVFTLLMDDSETINLPINQLAYSIYGQLGQDSQKILGGYINVRP